METMKCFNKGDVIFKQGQYADCMYDIQRGSVGIYADYGTEKETLLTTLTVDLFFGEMGMLDAYPRSATAVAMEDRTELNLITGETFSDYFRNQPAKVLLIMQQMSHRIRELTEDYLKACRAVDELVESEQTGKPRSGWLVDNLKRFMDDYDAACNAAMQAGVMPMHYW